MSVNPRTVPRVGKVRREVPRIQEVAAGPSLLGLPAEVRNMVYRLLLVADKPLGSKTRNPSYTPDNGLRIEWAKFGKYHLQPAILCTCRQVYQEAKPVLFGENTIGIQVYGYEVPVQSEKSGYKEHYKSVYKERYDSQYYRGIYRPGDDDCEDESSDDASVELDINATTYCMNFALNEGTGHSRNRLPFLRQFQRIEVVIEAAILDLEDVRSEIKALCSKLCKMPRLEHVSLHLSEDSPKSIHPGLGPLGILRNMRSVLIRGVPQPLAERLQGLMLGATSQENVEGMLHLLENFVKGPKESLSDLEQASLALQEWDFQKFQETRSKILLERQRYMEDAILHIRDHDPKAEKNPSSSHGREE